MPQSLEAEAGHGAEAGQGAEEAQGTGEAQGDSFPRKFSTKFFHRDGQPNTYIGSFRWKVFQTFENPAFSNLARLISIVVMATILVSTLTFIFESEACEPTSFVPAKMLKAFLVIEIVSVTIFTIEYVCRLSSCPKPAAFFVAPLNLVDLLAILPFYLSFALGKGKIDPFGCRDDLDMDGNAFDPSAVEGEDSGIPNLGFLRVIRLVRIFRVFKFGRYSLGLQMFVGCLKASTQPLGILAVIVVIASTVFGALINICEASTSPLGDAQDVLSYLDAAGRSRAEHDMCFGTIIRGYWWSFVTMTTVGYGDCYPVTPLGKILTTFAMISGVLALALPITVIGSNFAKMVEAFAEEAAELQSADTDGTGLIDEMELRNFIAAKKREGVLAPGVDTNIQRLMDKYSAGGTGFLDAMEFARLQEEILSPQDKAMGTLEQVGISVAFQEENARIAQTTLNEVRDELSSFVAAQDKRLSAIEAMLLNLGQRVDAK